MKNAYLYDTILEDYKADEIKEQDKLESADDAAMSYFRSMIECNPHDYLAFPAPTNKEFVGIIYGDWELYHDYGAGYYFAMIVK